jgi:hypothetical protein
MVEAISTIVMCVLLVRTARQTLGGILQRHALCAS